MEEKQHAGIAFAEAISNQYGIPYANEISTQNTPNENAISMEEPPAWGLATEALDFDFEFDDLSQINGDALNGLTITAAKNPQVKELLGDDFEYTNYHQYGTDYGWQPILNYRTDNGEYTVSVTMDKDRVVDVVKYKTLNVQLGGPYIEKQKSPISNDYQQQSHFPDWSEKRGYAIDEYNDNRYDATGMGMYVHMPDYTHNAGDFTALLLNAVKEGSNVANLCDPTKYLTDYWGQIGFFFDADGTTLVYTDTTLGCKATILPYIQYNVGDRMFFGIYIKDTTDEWFLYANNRDDSSPPVAWVTVVPGSSLLDIDTPNTSVFFESNNHWWYGDWASGFASDPVVDAAIWQYTNNYWYLWFNENQVGGHCEPGTSGSELMHGTFVGYPYDVTFDVSKIQEKCPAPDW